MRRNKAFPRSYSHNVYTHINKIINFEKPLAQTLKVKKFISKDPFQFM